MCIYLPTTGSRIKFPSELERTARTVRIEEHVHGPVSLYRLMSGVLCPKKFGHEAPLGRSSKERLANSSGLLAEAT